jgi:outer membrane protein
MGLISTVCPSCGGKVQLDDAKEKGYKMVLTYSKSNPSILFADESLDVTKEVLVGLNAEYKKNKK